MITLKQFAINATLQSDSKYTEAIGHMLTENQVLALINGVVKNAKITNFKAFCDAIDSDDEIVDARIDNVGDGSYINCSYNYKSRRFWNDDHTNWGYSKSERYCNEEEWIREASVTVYYADIEKYGITINQ